MSAGLSWISSDSPREGPFKGGVVFPADYESTTKRPYILDIGADSGERDGRNHLFRADVWGASPIRCVLRLVS